MHHLPDRPSSRPIRRLELSVAQSADERPKVRWSVFDRLQVYSAGSMIQRLRQPLEPSDGVPQLLQLDRVQFGHAWINTTG
jgi:hypothetical protein